MNTSIASRISHRIGSFQKHTWFCSFQRFAIDSTSHGNRTTHLMTHSIFPRRSFVSLVNKKIENYGSFFPSFGVLLAILISWIVCLHAHVDEQPQSDLKVDSKLDNEDLSVDFAAKIDARRFIMVDVNGQEHDFGSYFHGYGKGLVKGMNLHFRKIVHDNGTKEIELSFKINHIVLQRLRDLLYELEQLTGKEQQTFAGLHQSKSMTYRYLPEKKVSHVVVLEGLGSLMLGHKFCYSLSNQVKVTLPEGATFESFHQFLSIFGLEEALKRSTKGDIERLKIGVLFRTFFPTYAYGLERDESFFTLPLDQLKEKMITMAPAMEQIFGERTVEKKELLPGYVRYGVPVDQDLRSLGGRALTTVLTTTSLNSELVRNDNTKKFELVRDPLQKLPDDEIDMILNILKNGLLSQDLRKKHGVGIHSGLNSSAAYWRGAAQSIFALMVTNEDIDKRKKIDSIHWSDEGSVRLFISLKAFNLGSYPSYSCSEGAKHDDTFINRPNIFEFVKKVSKNPTKFSHHEITLPDLILPEHIMAMATTAAIKEQIITRARQLNFIQKDQDGKERINGILVDELIRTDDHITPELVKNCS